MRRFNWLISIVLVLSIFLSPISQMFVSIAYAEEQEPSQDFIFDEETGTITGYKDGNAPENLVIPAEINGVPVEHIGRDAFKYSSNNTSINAPIKTLVLPEGLKTTAYMSFQGNELTEVTIPSTLEVLGERTLGLNKKLKTVNFAEGSKIKTLEEESLYDCAIENITLPEGLEEIGARALAGNVLTSIEIPTSVTKIGKSAFQLNLIEEFHVPENIETINGGEDTGGLFYRNFNNPEKASSNLRLTKVYDTSGRATVLNTRGIVNPVSADIKYVNLITSEEIKEADSIVGIEDKKIVIGKHPIYGWDVAELADGDGGYVYDYMTPSENTDLYIKYFEEISSNYFVKDQEVIFTAPEIPGFDTPVEVVKTLNKDSNEVIFSYPPLGNVNLTLEGEGLISSVAVGQVPIGQTVTLTIEEPVGKKISSFTIKDIDKMDDLTSTGITSSYTFVILEDTIVKVEYEDVSYEDEFRIEVDKSELKLGEKTNVKAFYRDALVYIPNDDITWTVDHEDAAVIDTNTGEVITLKSGAVVLKGALKNRHEISGTVTLSIKPIRIKVRVEANFKTLLNPVEVEVRDLDLSKYNITATFEEPKAIHAITKALDDHKETTGIDPANKDDFNAGSTGNYISEIAGYDDSGMSGWMYYIDNKFEIEGVAVRTIVDGEYINVWYIDTWMENTYVYFEPEEYSAKEGKEVELQLVGSAVDMWTGEPIVADIEGITILNDTIPLEKVDGNYYITDADGKVTLTFDKAGDYHISAMKTNDDDEMIISRPYAVVKVAKPATKPVEPWPVEAGIPEEVEEPNDPNIPDEGSYTDVSLDDWFHDAVNYITDKGLMKGIGDGKFAPNSLMTRSMLVTVLYRYVEEPLVEGINKFSDVSEDEWYTNAIIWASENGIVEGYGDGLFGTNDDISREQVATILMRFAKLQGLDTSKRADLSDYSDASKISSWAQDAMEWANANNLIKGRSATSLAPQGTATRAEVATILQRFVEDFIK